jgi:hypothetical protein
METQNSPKSINRPSPLKPPTASSAEHIVQRLAGFPSAGRSAHKAESRRIV